MKRRSTISTTSIDKCVTEMYITFVIVCSNIKMKVDISYRILEFSPSYQLIQISLLIINTKKKN